MDRFRAPSIVVSSSKLTFLICLHFPSYTCATSSPGEGKLGLLLCSGKVVKKAIETDLHFVLVILLVPFGCAL